MVGILVAFPIRTIYTLKSIFFSFSFFTGKGNGLTGQYIFSLYWRWVCILVAKQLVLDALGAKEK